MKLLTGILIASISISAEAAPFLRSDSWPTGKPQPTHCIYQEGSDTIVEVPVTLDSKSLPYCKWDLSTVTREVSHTYRVWVKNETQVSAEVSYTFTLPPIAISVPKNLREVSR